MGEARRRVRAPALRRRRRDRPARRPVHDPEPTEEQRDGAQLFLTFAAPDGEAQADVMRAERLSLDDLYGAARQQGIDRIGSVRLAVLETNGQISFFPYESAGDAGAESGSFAWDPPRP